MAEIRRILWWGHLRAESTSHVLVFRRGRLRRSGRGLSFWFAPLSAAVAEVPVDDRDLPFLFHGRSADYQDVTAQGVITYRVVDAARLAERIDFSIDLLHGRHRKEPLEQLASLMTGLAQQIGLSQIARSKVLEVLETGFETMQQRLEQALTDHPSLAELGLSVVDVRLNDLSPTPELTKALQTPTREELKQAADEATFQRRAVAVDKERAIAENELANRVELAKREEALIAQEGSNAQQRAEREARAKAVEVTARTERQRIETAAEVERMRDIQRAEADGVQARVDCFRDLKPPLLLALTAQDVAEKLQIEHLNLSPEMLTPMLRRLLDAGATRLEKE